MHIYAYNTHIEIFPYSQGQCKDLEKYLSIWDKDKYKFKPTGYHIEDDKLLVPRSVSFKYLEQLFKTKVIIKDGYDSYKKIKIDLKLFPRNDKQIEGIEFLLGVNKYENLKFYTRKLLSLGTGVGKTYCAVAAASSLGVRTAIIVHDHTLLEQWISRIEEYTDISKDDMYIISGSKSIDNIMNKKNLDNKVFIISHRTIQSYAKSHGWTSITKLFIYMNIGLKIIDEAHKEFKNTIMIDLYTNTRWTYYLTATAKRSSLAENRLYSIIFRIPQLTIETENRQDNYINMNIILFNSKPHINDIVQCSGGKHGFSIAKYSDYLTSEKGFKSFSHILDIFLNTIQDRDGKCAILIPKNKSILKVYDYIIKTRPHLADDLGIYSSIIKEKDKIRNKDKKIILSTSKSMGTGADIADLKYLLMAEPYNNDITLKQVTGRLRNIGNVYYFEIVDNGFPRIKEQYRNRKKKLIRLSKKFKEVQMGEL